MGKEETHGPLQRLQGHMKGRTTSASQLFVPSPVASSYWAAGWFIRTCTPVRPPTPHTEVLSSVHPNTYSAQRLTHTLGRRMCKITPGYTRIPALCMCQELSQQADKLRHRHRHVRDTQTLNSCLRPTLAQTPVCLCTGPHYTHVWVHTCYTCVCMYYACACVHTHAL